MKNSIFIIFFLFGLSTILKGQIISFDSIYETLPGSFSGIGQSLVQLKDSGFIAGGVNQSNGSYCIRVDKFGHKIWSYYTSFKQYSLL